MSETATQETFIPYAKQSITEEDIKSVTDVMKSDFITRGPKVEEFEQAIADYCGAQHAVVFNSGSSALYAAYFAADISPYDRVLTTPNSFVATINGALQQQAKVRFVDIDRSTGNIDIHKLAEVYSEAQTSRGRRFVVPVHFAGLPLEMDRVDQILSDPDDIVIEDASHAIGGSYTTGERVGSCRYSDMTVFSFHPAKNFTSGEGGAVTTNDANYARHLRLYRNNGMVRDEEFLVGDFKPWYYEVHAIAENYNFTEFQAALGLSQLGRLDQFVEKRRSLVKKYRALLEGMDKVRLFTDQYDDHIAFHLLVAQIDFLSCRKIKSEVMMELRDRGIGTQVHYIPIYHHPIVKNVCGEGLEESFPEMEGYYTEALSLPLYVDMEEKDVERVVQQLKEVLA